MLPTAISPSVAAGGDLRAVAARHRLPFRQQNPEAGLDCSGMVAYTIFAQAAGLQVSNSADIAVRGAAGRPDDLIPGRPPLLQHRQNRPIRMSASSSATAASCIRRQPPVATCVSTGCPTAIFPAAITQRAATSTEHQNPSSARPDDFVGPNSP